MRDLIHEPRVPRRQVHRVRRGPAPPPLPKEVTPTGPRAYVDRFGVEYEVVWAGAKTDWALSSDGWARE
jgi:hypothetical protein